MAELLATDFADVSVVMPAYQAEACIERALASIAGQRLRPREVIVVDDGSTDGTIAAINAFRPHMNGITLRLFRQTNQGAGAARNRALVAARGEWIAFLDADDKWLPDKLAASMAVMNGQDLIMSSHNLFAVSAESDDPQLIDSRARYLNNPSDPYRTLFLRGFISSSTVVVRRDAVITAGGFDPGLRSAQDYELWLAILAKAGPRFVTFVDPLLCYTLAPHGITSQIRRKYDCSLAILRRHTGILSQLPGPVLRPLILRTAAIHLEAFRGYRALGRPFSAFGICACFPLRLIAALLHLPFARGTRPDFLARMDPVAEEIE
jgi:glycosyltransferase involved in cell wall biosynthesis